MRKLDDNFDERLKKLLGIGNEFCINLTEAPVLGGYKVYSLQSRASGAPLWYDHLPNLAMRVQINGIMSNFQLVKNKTILPIRGQKITGGAAAFVSLSPRCCNSTEQKQTRCLQKETGRRISKILRPLYYLLLNYR